jgi:catechol 2,3-dioxygenase-like lactoylglutathione lyase family enzyme
MSTLAEAPVSAGLPASDIARAKAFYKETLGLPMVGEFEGSVMFECGDGTRLFVYPSEYAGTNQATAAGWQVADIEAAMDLLGGRGVTFEEYDLPGLQTVDGIATLGSSRSSWFKDTEGNILALIEGSSG